MDTTGILQMQVILITIFMIRGLNLKLNPLNMDNKGPELSVHIMEMSML